MLDYAAVGDDSWRPISLMIESSTLINVQLISREASAKFLHQGVDFIKVY